MKRIRDRIKKIWWVLWEVDENDKASEHLSSLDKRWLIYWNFMTCFGVVLLFLLVTGINNARICRQNDKYVEETIGMIATYMASATKDEYDKIARSIRHDLVFSEYGEEMENLDECRGGTIMNFGYDEVSQTSLHVSKSPDQKEGYAELDRGRGITSVHRMKSLFCDDCIRDILNTVGHKLIEEFVLFDTEERDFYAIDDGTAVQIGDYSLEIACRNSDYRITIKYTSK